MRPLQLTMQAFGPYPDRQTVDFAAAIQCGLFGVYGPTGAGKSSIFSAISFALFGEPAKGEQDPASLRSDHAAATTLTEVELIFEVGANRYLIRRRPDQVRPAARGGGETKEKHGAWLFDITGIPLNEVTADNPGKVIAEKKVSEVTPHVERLLGYGAAQFRQIVLLPQGRFETFLTAKTDERLRILRELFDVSLYRRLALKLKDEARTARDRIQTDLRVHGELLKREACQTLEELDAAATQEGSDATAHEATAKITDAAAQEAAKALGQANQVERNFAECDAARAAVKLLQSKTTDMQRNQLMLSGAQQALSLADVDAAVVVAQDRVEKAKSASIKAASRHADAKIAADKAIAALNVEKDQSEQTRALVGHRADLSRHRTTLGDADVQRADLATAVQGAKEAEKAQSKAQTDHVALQGRRTTRASELTLAEQKIQTHATLSTEIQERQRQESDARQYEKAAKGLADAKASATTAEKGVREAEATEAVALAAFEDAEAKLSQAQAIHLAEKLVDGEACPVCGSSEHPSPAKGDAASAGLDAAFRSARNALDGARTKHSDAKTVLAGAHITVTERKSTLDALPPPVGTAADLLAALTSLKQRRDALGALPDLDVLKRVLSELDAEIEKAGEAVESARNISAAAKTNEALARQALGSALASIPIDLRSEDALSAAIRANEALIKQREEALEAATSGERLANETLVACARDDANAVTLLATAKADLDGAMHAFAARLAEVGLSDEQYRIGKAVIGRIEELRTLITNHEREMVAAESRVKHGEEAVAGIARPDIASLKKLHDEKAKAREEATSRAADTRSKAERLKALVLSLGESRAAIEKAETAFRPLDAVAAAMNGDNDAKVDLETFAIAAMFDRVLEAANLRLKPMSDSRYTLQRDQDGGKGAAKRGLGIVVHDVHTGRPRATSTLSGGESFQAALSLALGLSDVVESLSGGIRLDMIFIDEGFGSLDNHTLDQALQTLQDLVGQSRAVGLISHIELVQQVIPNGFQIEKTIKGSIIRTRAA